MSKTETTAPFSDSNTASDAGVSSGGNKEGGKFAGWETATNVTTPDGLNGRWNGGVMEQKRKEFCGGTDYNKSY